jgi:hypothetical protein
MWAVMDEFEERGVVLTSAVWASAFHAIGARMPSAAVAMQVVERMSGQRAARATAAVYAAAINCLDGAEQVETVLAKMREARVAADAAAYLAVMRACERARLVALAERTVVEYVGSNVAWRDDIFVAFKNTVSGERAAAFERTHAEQLKAKRAAVTAKAARLAPSSSSSSEHLRKRARRANDGKRPRRSNSSNAAATAIETKSNCNEI